MMTRAQSSFLVGLCLLGLGPRPAIAGIHTWDVSEVFSNADGTIQFVELVEANGTNFETGVSGGTISSTTPTAHSFHWSSAAVSGTAFKKYLVATPAFAALTGAPTPDAIITPGSNIPFFATSGDTVSFLSYDSCTFGAVPTNGKDAIDCVPVTPTTAVNSPTNYAGPPGTVRAAIAGGNVDNFQNTSLQNWESGSTPTNQPSGQGGVSDLYLQLTASGGALGAFNQGQWAGNYVAAAIDHLDVDLNNSAGDPLSIRVMLLTTGCESGGTACTAWTSTNAQAVPSGSGWVTKSFSIKEADLTRVLGGDSYTTSLSNVERVLIRHDDDTPSPPDTEPTVSATLGIDDVTAVLPEPSGLLGLAAGAALLGAVRRRHRAPRT